MKKMDNTFVEKLYGNRFNVERISETDSEIDITLRSNSKVAVCPVCGKLSKRKHSTYGRKIMDTPLRNKKVKLDIKAYQFYCEEKNCECRVFSETLDIAEKSRSRTKALDQFILAVACEFSSEGASRILKRLGVTVSNDTIDRIVARIEIVDNPEITAIGVDDFAYRKGQTYCTAIYDLDTHKPIAILDGRTGKGLKEWLSGHKKVAIVARDRDCAYAKAISEILPDCVQVADKFHLMQNLLNAIKEIAKEELPKMIRIKGGEIIDAEPIKAARCDIKRLDYDNLPVIDGETGEVIEVSARRKFSKNYLNLKKNGINIKS